MFPFLVLAVVGVAMMVSASRDGRLNVGRLVDRANYYVSSSWEDRAPQFRRRPCPPCPWERRETRHEPEGDPDNYEGPYRRTSAEPEREREPERQRVEEVGGEIGWDTADEFRIAPIVSLSGPGGMIDPAFQIGDKIAAASSDTIIRAGEYCNSACAMIWISGAHRYLLGYAGFHAPTKFHDEDGRAYRTHGGERAVADYYRKHGLSDKFIDWSMSAGPNSMAQLTPELAERLGIKVETEWRGEKYEPPHRRGRGW